MLERESEAVLPHLLDLGVRARRCNPSVFAGGGDRFAAGFAEVIIPTIVVSIIFNQLCLLTIIIGNGKDIIKHISNLCSHVSFCYIKFLRAQFSYLVTCVAFVHKYSQ